MALPLAAPEGEKDGVTEVDRLPDTVPQALKEMEELGVDESEPVTETLAQADSVVDSEAHGVGVLVRHRVVLRLALPLLVKLEVLHALLDTDAVWEVEGEPVAEKLALGEYERLPVEH